MTDVKDLVAEATAKLRKEAEFLREAIAKKEQALADELAPARAQLAQLDDAIARIEGKPVRTSHGSTRAPRGHNRKLILDALNAKSGMTAAEIAKATRISQPTVFATLAKLEQDGLVEKDPTGSRVAHSLTAQGRKVANAVAS